MNGNVRLQFIDKLPPAFSAFRCIGAVDAVSEFGDSHGRDDDRRIDIGRGADIAEHFRRGELGAFSGNEDTRVED